MPHILLLIDIILYLYHIYTTHKQLAEIFGFYYDLRFGQDEMGKSLSDNIAYAQFRLYSADRLCPIKALSCN